MEHSSSRDLCLPLVSKSGYTDMSDPQVRSRHLRPCENETRDSTTTKTTDLSPGLTSLFVLSVATSSPATDRVSHMWNTTGLRTIVSAIGVTPTSLSIPLGWSTISPLPETHTLSAALPYTSVVTATLRDSSSLSLDLLSSNIPSPLLPPVFSTTGSISSLPQPASSDTDWFSISLANLSPLTVSTMFRTACSDTDDAHCVTSSLSTNIDTTVTTVTSQSSLIETETEAGVTSTISSSSEDFPPATTVTEAVSSSSAVTPMLSSSPYSPTQVPAAWPPSYTISATGSANSATLLSSASAASVPSAVSSGDPMAKISATPTPAPASHHSHSSSTATKIAVPIVIAVLIVGVALLILLHKRKKRHYKEDRVAEKAEWLEPGYVERIRAQMGAVDQAKVGAEGGSPGSGGKRAEDERGVREEDDKRDSGYNSNGGEGVGMGGWRVYRGTREIRAGEERSDVAERGGVKGWWRWS